MIAALVHAWAPQTFQVGPSGFPDIQSAIDAAAAGDLVLVSGGTYAAFTLTKPLTIRGTSATRPVVLGSSLVSGVDGFAFSRLDFRNVPGEAARVLEVADVNGRGWIDDCVVTSTTAGSAFGGGNALVIDSCTDVELSRSMLQGSPSALAVLSGSLATVTECTLTGSDGGASAGHGAIVRQSEALFVRGSVSGGDADDPCGAFGGHAIGTMSATVTTVGTELRPGAFSSACGVGEDGCHVGPSSPFPGVANALHLTGPCFTPSGLPSPCVECDINYSVLSSTTEPPLPALVGTGSGLPSTPLSILLYGPPGELGVIGMSLATTVEPLPGVSSYLWIDLGAPLIKFFYSVGQTFAVPSSKSTIAPPPDPALDGLALHFQGFFPALPGAGATTGILVTQPVSFVLFPN